MKQLVRSAFQDCVLLPAVRAFCAPLQTSSAATLDLLSGPVVIVANHASHLDTPALLAALPPMLRRHTAVAAAADYFYRSPLLGAACTLGLGTFPFPRHGRDGTRRAAELLADGWNVALFPQGSRGSGERIPFRLGVGHLLLESGVAALPIGISGTREAWPRGQRFPRRAAVRVRIGEVWKPDPRLSAREIVAELELKVRALMVDG